MVAATGVLVAAVYYILNLRRNKKTKNDHEKRHNAVLHTTESEHYNANVEVFQMEWEGPRGLHREILLI